MLVNNLVYQRFAIFAFQSLLYFIEQIRHEIGTRYYPYVHSPIRPLLAQFPKKSDEKFQCLQNSKPVYEQPLLFRIPYKLK